VIEEGIRYPGFAFINVQSPCVTFGQPDQQLKQHKATLQSLTALGHDPQDRLKAMDLAQAYGEKLYTGVFYRNPAPGPIYEALVRERQAGMAGTGPSRASVLEPFLTA
jgi:2-oxoglutarate ferredoxin oxidoreductase subunit beta